MLNSNFEFSLICRAVSAHACGFIYFVSAKRAASESHSVCCAFSSFRIRMSPQKSILCYFYLHALPAFYRKNKLVLLFLSLSLFPITLVEKKSYYFFCIFISMFDRWNSTGSGTISINLYIKYETKKKNEFAMKVRAPHFYSFNSYICCAISLFFDYVIFRAKPNRHLIDSHRTNSNSS